MAILTEDEFNNRLKEYVGERSSESDISFIEDMTDTFTSYKDRNSDYNDLQSRYDKLNDEWTERYKKRFFEGNSTTAEEIKNRQKDDILNDVEGKTSFEDLFKEREGS